MYYDLNALSLSIKTRLASDGFAIVPGLFENGEMGMLNDILTASKIAAADPAPNRFTRIVEAKGSDGGSRVDLSEIFYPSAQEPRLKATNIFGRCAALARALGHNDRCYFDSLITKSAHSRHCVFWHRDAQFTRSKNLQSVFLPRIHFWVPLQDVTPANGGLQFVSGSHKENNIVHLSEERIVAGRILAGDLAIHLPETLHYSAPNATDRPRSAWLMTFGRFGAAKFGLQKLLGNIPAPIVTARPT